MAKRRAKETVVRSDGAAARDTLENGAIPIGRARTPADYGLRADSWASVLTGIGTVTKDKRLSGDFVAERMDPARGEDLRRGDDVAARIVEAMPDEMTRQGFELAIEGDEKGLAEEVIAFCDEMDVIGQVHEALCVARATGGAGILLGAEDPAALRRPEEPLQIERVRRFEWCTVFNCEELRPVAYFDNATQRDYGRPSVYEIRERGFGGDSKRTILTSARPRVHASRIVRFDGVPVPRRYARETQGWGDSVLLRCAAVIRDYQMSWAGAAILLQEFAQTVFKLKDLAGLVSGKEDDLVVKRAQLVALSRSIANAVLIDEDESFERVTTPLAGMPEMLNQIGLRLTMAARTPAMILLGQSPTGLNATGEGDLRWWYDTTRAQQHRQLRPALNVFVRLAFQALGAKEPANWTVRFPSLWQPTEKERAELRKIQAEIDQIEIANQIVLPEEIAVSRHGGDEWSPNTVIDVELRKRIGGERDPAELAEGEETPAATGEATTTETQVTPEDPEAVDPTTALNGAQVAAMLEIVTAVAEGKIPRETGIAMLNAAFPMSLEQAEKVMGTVGREFKITPAPAPAPFPGGRPGASSSAPAPGGDDDTKE